MMRYSKCLFWTNLSKKRRGWMWRAEMMLMTGPGEMFYLDREEGVRKDQERKTDSYIITSGNETESKKGGEGYFVNIT